MLELDVNLSDRVVKVDVAGHPVSFTVGPEDFGSLMGGFQWAEGAGLAPFDSPEGSNGDAARTNVGSIAASHFSLMRRVKAWDGIVGRDGQAVPCNDANKMVFFSKYPSVLMLIWQKLTQAEQDETKNCEASPAGLGVPVKSGTPAPAAARPTRGSTAGGAPKSRHGS
jgi:hypothetical protein